MCQTKKGVDDPLVGAVTVASSHLRTRINNSDLASCCSTNLPSEPRYLRQFDFAILSACEPAKFVTLPKRVWREASA